MTTKSNFPPISDNQSNLILTHYDTVRDLKTVIANAKRVLQQYVLNESGVENAELASLNQILKEITLFLQHNESFTTVPQEMAAVMAAIRQKKLLPAGNKLQSFTVRLFICVHP